MAQDDHHQDKVVFLGAGAFLGVGAFLAGATFLETGATFLGVGVFLAEDAGETALFGAALAFTVAAGLAAGFIPAALRVFTIYQNLSVEYEWFWLNLGI